MIHVFMACDVVIPGRGMPLPRGGKMGKNYVFQKRWTHADAMQSKEDLIRNVVSRKK